jgi:hypothetical protein
MFSLTLSYELIFRAAKLINRLERKSTKFQHAKKLFHIIETGTNMRALKLSKIRLLSGILKLCRSMSKKEFCDLLGTKCAQCPLKANPFF